MRSFSGQMRSFSGQMCSFSGRMHSFLLQDCFDLEIMYFVAAGFVYNATMFTLNWACANSVLGMCRHNWPCLTLFLTVLIDNYDTNITQTQTQTHWLNHLCLNSVQFEFKFPARVRVQTSVDLLTVAVSRLRLGCVICEFWLFCTEQMWTLPL